MGFAHVGSFIQNWESRIVASGEAIGQGVKYDRDVTGKTNGKLQAEACNHQYEDLLHYRTQIIQYSIYSVSQPISISVSSCFL